MLGSPSDCPSSPHMAAFGRCRCQCTFLDVGANDGDTLLTWMGGFLSDAPGAKWHEQLPSRLKGALQGCFESQRNMCFYGIEGNPRFVAQLDKLSEVLKKEGFQANLLTKTVLGLEDGITTMFVDPGVRGMDSTLLADKKTHYFKTKDDTHASWGSWVSSPKPVSNTFKHVNVTSLGAARFLSSLTQYSDFVGMKIDIEGFEYPLFRKLLVTEPQALCNLNLTHVDWHEHHLRNGSSDDVPEVASNDFAVRKVLEWLLTSKSCGVHWSKGTSGPPDAGTIKYLCHRTGTHLKTTNGFGFSVRQDPRIWMPMDLSPSGFTLADIKNKSLCTCANVQASGGRLLHC